MYKSVFKKHSVKKAKIVNCFQFFYSKVVRCQTLQRNLNFTDCLPYPGQSCYFSCKAGYRLVVNTTVSCGSDGQWKPPTDTLCKGEVNDNIV